ncbi:MAG TPA: hypothetical protein VNA57_04250 [Acidimicrobiales bacterium]|nr:hypothetical protein [Acidimicrobiales bacterium]
MSISDVVIADARTEKGIGVGAEMMFARMRAIPVVTVCPRNSNYRRDLVPDVFGEDLENWIHPFVFGLSDAIVDDVPSAVELINKLGRDGLSALGTPPVDDSIEYYNRVRETFERADV